MKQAARRVVLHLPLLAAVGVAIVASVDLPVFRSLKTESSYGWWVVVLMPATVLLLLAQIGIWIAVLRRGKGIRRPPRDRNPINP